MAFLEKNEVKTFQWEAAADLLNGAVQQWLKYRQDYLLETFHTVSLSQFIHFARRLTKHEATLLLRFLYPAKGWLDLDIHSRDNYIWNGHAVCLGSQGREAGTCRARMMLCQRKCQENSSLMASISLQCSVHICIKLILECSEMGWDKSSSRLPCMWKGEEYLRSSCCCPTIAAVGTHHYCFSCVQTREEVQHCFCSADVSPAEGCVGILLLWTLALQTIPLFARSSIQSLKYNV